MGNDGVTKVIGVGDVCLQTNMGVQLWLRGVKHAPDFHFNLISMHMFCDGGYDNHFGYGKWKLTKGNLVVAKGETLYTTVHVINLSPTVSLNTEVPNKIWFGKDVKLYDPIEKKLVRSDVQFMEDQTIKDIDKLGDDFDVPPDDNIEKEQEMSQDENLVDAPEQPLVQLKRSNRQRQSYKIEKNLSVTRRPWRVKRGKSGREHLNALKWILKYLHGTSDMRLYFGGDKPTLVGYSDSNMARDIDSRKSTSDYLIKFAKSLLSLQKHANSCFG
ncbi:hypothetical protein CR513_47131, partial [Mucuna pruriens]